jgi:hypothetical protein
MIGESAMSVFKAIHLTAKRQGMAKMFPIVVAAFSLVMGIAFFQAQAMY